MYTYIICMYVCVCVCVCLDSIQFVQPYTRTWLHIFCMCPLYSILYMDVTVDMYVCDWCALCTVHSVDSLVDMTSVFMVQ